MVRGRVPRSVTGESFDALKGAIDEELKHRSA
jgi:hypothetical protein